MDASVLNGQKIHIELVQPAQDSAEPLWTAVVGVQLLSCPSGQNHNSVNNDQPSFNLADQVDFINALFTLQPATTYAVRYITRPNRDSFSAGKVDVCVFGVIKTSDEHTARSQALELAFQLVMQLGGTFPNYKWHIISTPEIFQQFWQPIDWQTAYIAELRRREEWVELDKVRPTQPVGFLDRSSTEKKTSSSPVYYVHPFVPRPNRFERLLRIMLLHNAPIALTTIISPTLLSPAEERFLLDSIMTSEGYHAPTTQHMERIQEQRARLLAQGIMDQLLRLQDAPFLVTISLASPERIPTSICEATGVAVSAPVGEGLNPVSVEPLLLQKGGYDVVQPLKSKDLIIARNNLGLLSQNLWETENSSENIRRLRFLMDGYEASCAFRFPQNTIDGIAGLDVHSQRIRPLPREIAQLSLQNDTSKLLPLGENDYLGLSQPVCIPEKERLTHMYVVGQTGTGKTTLLKNMILADMQAGRGVGVIDPHGDLFEEILQIIPPERMKDVVIFDPMDSEYPVGFNLLECSSDQQRQIVVREMRAIMRRYLEDTYKHMAAEFTGPIFYQHMQMNMLLTMSDPNRPGTLLEFYQIYQSRNYWKRWMPLKWEDEQLRRWVDTALPRSDYTDRRNPQEASLGEYLSSKFIDFIFDPRLRLIFGQPRSSINLGNIMNEGKILLVNLAKGLIGEANAQFLGLILMAKFQAEVMSRAHQAPTERKPFYLYVDEFQSLATENFSVLLSEARKFGVSLILANQFISQIRDPKIMQSIFGNVGTLISFRLGMEDAHTIESQFLPYFDQSDLTNLPNWQACVRAKINGQTPSAFIMNTQLSSTVPSLETAAAVRKLSREQYGRPRKEVDQIICEALKEPELHEEVVEELNPSPFLFARRSALLQKPTRRLKPKKKRFHSYAPQRNNRLRESHNNHSVTKQSHKLKRNSKNSGPN